jgi:hypothetical protein
MKNYAVLAVGLLVTLFSLSLSPAAADDEAVDLSSIKTYLIENVVALDANASRLVSAAQVYYDLAAGVEFDYAALWSSRRLDVISALISARDAWITLSPLYEKVEGIVGGVPLPAFRELDINLDAGVSGADDPEGGVMFSLTLPDGRVLERPGNLFGVLESTIWGSRADYTSGVAADLNLNGELDFGDVLPDANVLLAAALTTREYTGVLVAEAEAWEPTIEDAFTALMVMIPTMDEFFSSWRETRFVKGADATRTDFVVISRLADIGDVLAGLQVIYDAVHGLIVSADAAREMQIRQDLRDLSDYVRRIYAQETGGRVFTPEEADELGREAQARAQRIAEQIVQVAAQLNIDLLE